MKKLEFLIGEWTGEARVQRGPGEPEEMAQTEGAQYKLDGLVLVVEGVSRTKSEGQIALQAFGIISYDDETRTYWMRAFNDGRFLATEAKLLDKGEGMTWGFTLGEIKTRSVMRINEKGEWSELGEITIGSQAPRKFIELTVRRRLGKKYTGPEKSWLRVVGRGGWIGTEFWDHDKLMRIVEVGKAYREGSQRLIDTWAIEIPTPPKPARKKKAT